MKKQIPDRSVLRVNAFLWSIVQRGRSDVASLCDVPERIASCDLSAASGRWYKRRVGVKHSEKTNKKDHMSDRQKPSSHIWKAKSATPPLRASLRTRRSSKFHFCNPNHPAPQVLRLSHPPHYDHQITESSQFHLFTLLVNVSQLPIFKLDRTLRTNY